MVYCNNCGLKNTDGAKFCPACGAPLYNNKTEETTPPRPENGKSIRTSIPRRDSLPPRRDTLPPRRESAPPRREAAPSYREQQFTPKKGGGCSKKLLMGLLAFIVVIGLLIGGILALTGGDTGDSGSNTDSLNVTPVSSGTTQTTENSHAKPRDGVEYIHAETGDKWGFVLNVRPDGGKDAICLAHFLGNGMQGRDVYEIRPQGGGRYVLYEGGKETPSGITMEFAADGNTVRVTREKAIRTGYGTEAAGTAVFKAPDSTGETVNNTDEDSPASFAINVGDHGGKWEVLQSGERAYVFPSGEYARSQWVKDGNTFYYVDVSGCRMLNNWAHDGFYAGADGQWDRSAGRIQKNVLPQNSKVYKDRSGKTWMFQMTSDADGTIRGKAHLTYPKGIDYQADYSVKSFGRSAYALYNINDNFDCWHAVVLDGGSTLRVSGAGVTEVYQ